MNRKCLLTVATLSLLLVALVGVSPVNSAEVVVTSSSLKDTYYQGDQMIIRIAIMNNATSENVLEIIHINTTIWRIEQRYKRWRNIELVYNKTEKIGVTIDRYQVFSTQIKIKIDFQPARYNLTVEVRARFKAGAGGEKSYYPIKGYEFWVKSSLSIPPIAWAIVVDVIIIMIAWIVYRRLK